MWVRFNSNPSPCVPPAMEQPNNSCDLWRDQLVLPVHPPLAHVVGIYGIQLRNLLGSSYLNNLFRNSFRYLPHKSYSWASSHCVHTSFIASASCILELHIQQQPRSPPRLHPIIPNVTFLISAVHRLTTTSTIINTSIVITGMYTYHGYWMHLLPRSAINVLNRAIVTSSL